jgi:hypothetical protein
MVRALLAGKKNMTRRVVKMSNYEIKNPDDWEAENNAREKGVKIHGEEYAKWFAPCYVILKDCLNCGLDVRGVFYPAHNVGDVLYVRETWCELWELDNFDQTIEGTQKYYYRADGENPTPSNLFLDGNGYLTREYPLWCPSIHMPKAAARIFLRVTGVRAERLQDISKEDIAAEGVSTEQIKIFINENPNNWVWSGYGYYFRTLWDSLNAQRGYSWASNPWVWVYEFERVERSEIEEDIKWKRKRDIVRNATV